MTILMPGDPGFDLPAGNEQLVPFTGDLTGRFLALDVHAGDALAMRRIRREHPYPGRRGHASGSADAPSPGPGRGHSDQVSPSGRTKHKLTRAGGSGHI
jgi:hypothetical protein